MVIHTVMDHGRYIQDLECMVPAYLLCYILQKINRRTIALVLV